MKQMKTNLIDADILAYEASAVNEVTVDWDGDGQKTQHEYNPKILEANLDRLIAKYAGVTKATNSIICLTDDKNFRLDVLPTYKSNRKGSVKPLQLAYAKEYMSSKYDSYQKPYLEADDVMGILSTHPTLIKGKKVIVSTDKDMKTIPGWLYNPGKQKGVRKVSAHEAMLYHMEQTITGDSVDGYKGCPGAGAVAAAEALDRALDEGLDWADQDQLQGLIWKEVVAVYESKGFTEDDALVQARCARILQYQDYDFKNNEVKLWRP